MPEEPCFKPCNDAARVAWVNKRNGLGPGGCKNLLPSALFAFTVGGNSGGSVILSLIDIADTLRCRDSADLTWHRALVACRASECGDPAKYPGGKVVKPPPKCDPNQEIRCGDTCCNIVDKCCQCQADGAFICCSAGSPCEPTPDRGGCCVGH
jgi:hypothetical protein